VGRIASLLDEPALLGDRRRIVTLAVRRLMLYAAVLTLPATLRASTVTLDIAQVEARFGYSAPFAPIASFTTPGGTTVTFSGSDPDPVTFLHTPVHIVNFPLGAFSVSPGAPNESFYIGSDEPMAFQVRLIFASPLGITRGQAQTWRLSTSIASASEGALVSADVVDRCVHPCLPYPGPWEYNPRTLLYADPSGYGGGSIEVSMRGTYIATVSPFSPANPNVEALTINYTLHHVPEPSTYGLMALALGGLVAARRRAS
jgi:hypothetical protein